MPIDAGKPPLLPPSATHVWTWRPSKSVVLRLGAPHCDTTSAYAAPCQEFLAPSLSPPNVAQPAKRNKKKIGQ